MTGESKDTTVGDLRGLSTNAQTMVRMAVLSAWAELQVASTDQAYLVALMEPHIAKLTPLWLSSLQEFARLRFEPDISSNSVSARTDEGLDTTYAALNRQTLLQVNTFLPTFFNSWLNSR
jgi:HEAT repeat-containing protein 5